jgi:diguanylate cyclase (GGDEF)-like protein
MNVSATYPLLSEDNEVIGFSLAGLNLSFFQRWLDNIDDPSVTISIMDFNQTLLARKPLTGERGGRVNDPTLEQFIQGDAASILVRVKSPVDGIDRLWTIRKIGRLPFVVAVGYALNDVLAPWRTELVSYIIGNILLALSTLFLAKAYYKNLIDTDKMKQLATYDQLTGLINRRSFEEIVNLEIQKDLENKDVSSIILIDIDHFKRVNDIHGHEAGDKILKEAADVILSSFRSSDIVSRWGGEEFIVFLSNTGLDSAAHMAERLKNNIESKEYYKGLHITVSQGVSSLSAANTYESLLKKADDMLYRAKNSGRNCVCCSY